MQLLYFSPVPWESFAQRPHKLIDWFQKKTGGKVLWIDPYPTRLPKITDWHHHKQTKNSTHRINSDTDTIEVLKPSSLPIEPIPLLGLINNLFWLELNKKIAKFIKKELSIIGVGKPSLMALQTLESYKHCHSFYDAMDDFPAFYNGISKWSMTKMEKAIVKQTQSVITSSTALHNHWYKVRDDIQLVPNALDPNTLPNETVAKPYRINKTFGYIGTVADWFDWEWLITLANLRPFDNIEVIGPIYNAFPSVLPRNIHLKPPLEHKDAIQTMVTFDVGLIPFKMNQLTHSVDPIKYYEYRALGLPILSTSFGEMYNRKDNKEIFIVDKLSDMPLQIDQALAYQANPLELEDFIHHHNWQHRFDNCRLLS